MSQPSLEPTRPGWTLRALAASAVLGALAPSTAALQSVLPDPAGGAATGAESDGPGEDDGSAAGPRRALGGSVVLGETLVTASRYVRPDLETPASTSVISGDTLRERGYRTTPQALRDVPGVMVQETSVGQGSPYIRGLTGFRNVFLVDGIRLNNSVFRDGPNQYWNTVDSFSLERLEVVKGPSSVLYGSDAIGGTVNAITRTPYAYGEEDGAAGRLHYRVSSAEQSHIVRGEASLAPSDTVGILVGATGKTFGELEGGKDTGRQRNTGYDEWAADFKVETFLDDTTRFVAAYQQVRQNDVPRTHRTIHAVPFEGTTVGPTIGDVKRDLDQERQLAYAQLYGEEFRRTHIAAHGRSPR